MEKKILLVEDDPDHAEIITEIMLDGQGNNNVEKEIILMKDGQEAIDYLEKAEANVDNEVSSQIELVLLDLNLPKVEGMEVLKYIKKSIKFRSVPVVILSTSSDKKTIAKAYDNGADSFIVKPISYDEFARKLMAMEEYWLIKYVGCSKFAESR